MDEIRNQVKRARWRLNLQVFGRSLFWCTLATMSVALLAILARKLWWFRLDGTIWTWSWLGGALVLSLLAALVTTIVKRRSDIEAAVELDSRFGLKERVASALMLHGDDRTTPFADALLSDTIRRVQRLDIREKFRVAANRWAWLPLAVVVTTFCIAFLPDAAPPAANKANAATVQSKKQVLTSAAALKERLKKQADKAKEQGLPEAEKLLSELEKGVNELAKREELDRKKAMVQLNDLAEKLVARRESLGGEDAIRKRLEQLQDMQSGPADRLADAMRKGDFQSAMNELQRLQEQLKSGDLSKEDQQKLAQQMQQMQQQMQQLAQMQEEMKQALQEQIQQMQQSGNLAEAAKLQKQLDRLQRQDPQMKKLQQLANQMAQCSNCLQQGDTQGAQAGLNQLASELQSMEQELEELTMLEDALTQIEDAKSSMNCKECNGMGCSACQGGMGTGMGRMGLARSQGRGQGLGEGRGQGERPEEETNSGFYDSRVRSQPRGGRAVAVGTAPGPNVAGDVRQGIKEAISSVRSAESDPLEGVHLPPDQRELTREYFEQFREGSE